MIDASAADGFRDDEQPHRQSRCETSINDKGSAKASSISRRRVLTESCLDLTAIRCPLVRFDPISYSFGFAVKSPLGPSSFDGFSPEASAASQSAFGESVTPVLGTTLTVFALMSH